MRTGELAAALGCEVLQGEFADSELGGGYTSDLLSDVMAHAAAGEVLITIQAHKNTVAVAVLVGMPAIIVCNSRPVPADMLEAARSEGVAILRTSQSQYLVSGRLYTLLGGA
jgi:hypothetical protein